MAAELDERGAVAFRQSHAGALFLGADRRYRRVRVEGLAAPLVDDAGHGADLHVGEGGNLLLEEIDEAAVALEQGEELEGGIDGLSGRRLLAGLGDRAEGLGRG